MRTWIGAGRAFRDGEQRHDLLMDEIGNGGDLNCLAIKLLGKAAGKDQYKTDLEVLGLGIIAAPGRWIYGSYKRYKTDLLIDGGGPYVPRGSFYRINLITVHLPALRERREGRIPLLARYFGG